MSTFENQNKGPDLSFIDRYEAALHSSTMDTDKLKKFTEAKVDAKSIISFAAASPNENRFIFAKSLNKADPKLAQEVIGEAKNIPKSILQRATAFNMLAAKLVATVGTDALKSMTHGSYELSDSPQKLALGSNDFDSDNAFNSVCAALGEKMKFLGREADLLNAINAIDTQIGVDFLGKRFEKPAANQAAAVLTQAAQNIDPLATKSTPEAHIEAINSFQADTIVNGLVELNRYALKTANIVSNDADCLIDTDLSKLAFNVAKTHAVDALANILQEVSAAPEGEKNLLKRTLDEVKEAENFDMLANAIVNLSGLNENTSAEADTDAAADVAPKAGKKAPSEKSDKPAESLAQRRGRKSREWASKNKKDLGVFAAKDSSDEALYKAIKQNQADLWENKDTNGAKDVIGSTSREDWVDGLAYENTWRAIEAASAKALADAVPQPAEVVAEPVAAPETVALRQLPEIKPAVDESKLISRGGLVYEVKSVTFTPPSGENSTALVEAVGKDGKTVKLVDGGTYNDSNKLLYIQRNPASDTDKKAYVSERMKQLLVAANQEFDQKYKKDYKDIGQSIDVKKGTHLIKIAQNGYSKDAGETSMDNVFGAVGEVKFGDKSYLQVVNKGGFVFNIEKTDAVVVKNTAPTRGFEAEKKTA